MAEQYTTKEELQEAIKEQQEMLDMARSYEAINMQTIRNNDGYLPQDMSEEQLREVKKANENLASSRSQIFKAVTTIKSLNEKMDKLAPRKKKEQSIASSQSSAAKKLELKTEEKLLQLRHDHEDALDVIDLEIEEKQALPDSQEKIEELAKLEFKKKTLQRSFDREKRHVEESAALERRKLDAEDDDYQSLDFDSDEERTMKSFKYEGDPRASANVEEPHEMNLYRSRREGRPELMDKESMMVQLMQQQMSFMNRSQGSFMDKKLPEFSGDPSDWGNFKAAYDRTTEKFKIEDSDNLSRLQSVLKGEAKDAVRHLMSNVKNVPRIMEVLEERFGQAEYVLDFLIEKAKNAARPDPAKPKTVVDFGTAVDDLVVNICSYNEIDYMNNKQLVKELVEKLPGSMKSQWYRWLTSDSTLKTNLENFSTWLKTEVAIAMKQMRPEIRSERKAEERKEIRRPRGSINAAEGNEEWKQTCPCCGMKNHDLSTCWSLKKKTCDERWKIVKEARACFSCLKTGHITSSCPNAKDCGKDGCNRQHHQLLHGRPKSEGFLKKEKKDDESPAASSDGIVGAMGPVIQGTDGPLAIVPVRLKGKNGQIRCSFALLDSGASHSLINKDLADELELDGKDSPYSFKVLGGKVNNNSGSKSVSLQISGRYRNARLFPIVDVNTVADIGLSAYSLDVEAAKAKWPHFQRYKGPSLNKAVPEIVIGGDNGYLLMHRELLYTSPEEPVAMRTVLGWVMQGKLPTKGNVGTGCCLGGVSMDDVLHNLIKESFRFDEQLIKDGDKPCMSRDDKKALEIMEATTTQDDDGVWETSLLWKNDEPFPEDGYKQALSRLMTAERRMNKDSLFAAKYKEKIAEYQAKGYIRKLSAEEVADHDGRTHYISHFGVVNPNKPGKFRLVFDAKEKAGDVSINDRLFTGPDLIRPLTTVLWNFRRHPVVICGDIEDMFHRVRIRKEDRKSQRFLWRDGDSSRQPDVYEMEVMIFGATSSPSCAIFVKNKNAERFVDKYPEAVSSIVEDTYVDDCCTGAQTIEEAIELRRQINEICGKGNFLIKKWLSNEQTVMESIPEELRLNGSKPLSEKDEWGTERMLGLWYDSQSDEFTFTLKFNKVKPEVLNGEVVPTKREMCSLLMSMFDPLGFLGHYKIKGMILLQRVWKSGVGWDDSIPKDVIEDWLTWIADMKKITEIRIPRCYSYGLNEASVQLHTFVDSSAEAFAAISFFRIDDGNKVEVVFVASSVKVAPLKKKTIPKLEMDAAVLGAKLAKKILDEVKVPISAVFYWSDSSTVLSWIGAESSRFKEYVANRISKIQDLTNAADWRWVPTLLNVADDATRLQKPTDFSSDSRWLRGPEFLKLSPDNWPKKKIDVDVDPGYVAALVGKEEGTIEVLYQLTPNLERFSSFYRLVRATAAVGAAAKHWLYKTRKEETTPPWQRTGYRLESLLPSGQLQEAEKAVIRVIQKDLGDLKNFRKLSPVIDSEGIVRVQGRIGNADCVDEDTRRPILLPAKNHVTDLIIDAEHQRNAHVGRNTVYNTLRQKYWIVDGRHAVRRSFSRCNMCRIKKAKPVVPVMGELPFFRLQAYAPPFTYCGIDMFGPIEITVGRRHEKRWGVLITDLVMRGVYLDVAGGLSADDSMLVLSRFVDQHGLPLHFYSDNGTNFIAVAKEVEKRQRYHGASWHFIPAGSPHMGGAWESLVKETKRALYNMLKEKYPREQVLLTVMKAAQNIVNSRPLSFASGDLDDPECLTPNHFLRGIGVASVYQMGQGATSGSEYFGDDIDEDTVRWGKQWEKAQGLAKNFWDRWTREVLPDLLRRNKWNREKEPLQVGDVVLMVDELKPRNAWVKALVSKTFPGKDGVVRVVEVSVRSFRTKTCSTYKRAVAKVCPIGVRVCDLATIPEAEGTKSGGRK